MQLTIPTIDEIEAAVNRAVINALASHQIYPTETPDEIGGVELASRITGKAVPTIYGLVHDRLIPHSKRGKQLYFSKNELLKWIADGRRKTHAESLAEYEAAPQKRSTKQKA